MNTLSAVIAAALALCSFCPCHAATWIVDQGGGGDALTINGGMALAAAGDTVLVGAGTYLENVVMGDGIVLLSAWGSAVTTVEPEVDSLPAVTCLNLPGRVVIEGFTVRGGRARVGAGVYCESSLVDVVSCRLTDNVAVTDGGGIAYVDCGSGLIAGSAFDFNGAGERGGGVLGVRSNLTIESSTFVECTARYGAGCCCVDTSSLAMTGSAFGRNVSDKWGGGIAALYVCSVEVTGCTFNDNSAAGSGGSIVGWDACSMNIAGNHFADSRAPHGGGIEASNYSGARVEGNRFTRCSGTYGGAVFNHRHSYMEVIGNEFDGNSTTTWGGAVCFRDTSTGSVCDNSIYSNSAVGGGGVKLWDQCDAEITGNVFWGNTADYGGAIGITNLSSATCRSNTFYCNEGNLAGAVIDSYSGSSVIVERCILAGSLGAAAVYCWSGGAATSDCNDFWANASDFYGCSAGPNDFFLDPLLCDPDNGDFQIDCQSPCNAHQVCGRVGALGVGCGATRTEQSTWGRLKSMWR